MQAKILPGLCEEKGLNSISTHTLTMHGIKEIRIPLSETEYMDLSTKKGLLRLTWRDLLSQGTEMIFKKYEGKTVKCKR